MVRMTSTETQTLLLLTQKRTQVAPDETIQ